MRSYNPELWGERAKASESNERPTGESDHERIVMRLHCRIDNAAGDFLCDAIVAHCEIHL